MRILIVLLFCASAYAQQMSSKIRNLYIETQKHMLTNKSFFIPSNEKLTHSLNMGLNLDLTKNIYSNHLVTSQVGTYQFRHIGYESELGYRSRWGIDIYIKHFSGHALDFQYTDRFPEENCIGLRFNLIRN